MKKSAIAVAVLGSLATASYAQNVSLYGVADAAVVSSSAVTSSGDVSVVGLVSGGHSTSRFGLRGTEDLGGGLRAHFGFEAGVTLDTGVAGGPTGATGNRRVTDSIAASNQQLFSRGAFIGVEGPFGRVNAGKISTPGNGWINTYTPGSGNHDGISMRAAAFGQASQMATWRDNTVEYVSPTFSGVTLRFAQTFGNTTQNVAAATNTGSEGVTVANKDWGKGTDLTVTYAMGPLNVGLFSSNLNLSSSGTIKEKATGLGASYRFGNTSVGIWQTTYDGNDTTANDKRKSTGGGVNYPVSAALGLRASFGSVENQATVVKSTFRSVAADYNLSKRTVAYGFYTAVSNSGTGTAESIIGMAAGNSTIVGTPAAGTDVSVMGVGVRHSF